MDAAQTEKLKALALATPKYWYSTYQITDGIGNDESVAFIHACSPATVLELIAEVECLRGELAAGAARQGGGTSLEGITRYEEYGNESGGGLQEAAAGEFVRIEDVERLISSAPAAGTEKDAERLDFMAQHEAWIAHGKDGESCRLFHRNDEGDAVPMLGWGARHWRHDIREAIDAAILAHTKAREGA